MLGEAAIAIRRPLAKPVIPSRQDVVHAIGAVPGGAEVPFIVGIKREQFPLGIEGEPVRIAEAPRDQLPSPAVRVDADHVPCGNLGVGVKEKAVPVAGTQRIFGEVSQGRQGRNIVRIDPHIVAMNGIDHAIGTKREGVASMPNSPGGLPEQRLLVVAVVIVGVAQSIQSPRVVGVGEQRPADRQHPPALFERVVDDLEGIDRRQAVTQQPLPLPPQDDPSAVIERQADPRPFARSRTADQLDLEAGQDGDLCRGVS